MLLDHVIDPQDGKDTSGIKTAELSNIRRVLNNISNSLLDEKDSFGTVSGTSCTSGFTTRALGLQQKLRWRKNQKREKKEARNNNDLHEISEEYDIQTIVSGLTRNSEFLDERDPPPSMSDHVDDDDDDNENVDGNGNGNENDDVVNCTSEWPDDETCGDRAHPVNPGHHVIRIMDGNQMTSKNTIRRHQENRVSQCHEENTISLSNSRGMRSKVPKRETILSKAENIPRNDPGSGYEVVLSSEPEGTKFRNGRKTMPMEPSGTKIEALIFGCALKNQNHTKNTKKTSRRRSPTVLMNDQDVEVVYQEKVPYFSDYTAGDISRRRSRSTGKSGYPIKGSNEKRKNYKSEDTSHRLVDGKRRSHSLPRTVKHVASRYREGGGAEFKDDLSSTRSVDEISTLGSQCEGIESQLSMSHSHQIFSAHSCEGIFSPHPREAMFKDPEPRVCVEFSRRKSGGYCRTTCLEYQEPTDATNYSRQKMDEKKSFHRHPKKEAKTPDDASKIVFPGFDTKKMQALPENFSVNSKRDRLQIDAIAVEASRNLLLSPNGEEDSFVENDNLFENSRLTPSSRFESLRRRNKFATGESNQFLVPVTPTPEKELRREFSGHKSSAYIDDSDVTHLSMTPGGRKDLIQRYLALREEHRKSGTKIHPRDIRQSIKNVSKIPSARSANSGYDRSVNRNDANSIIQDSLYTRSNKINKNKSGYDDASTHYQNTDSEQLAFRNYSAKENHGKTIKTISEPMGRVATPLSSDSMLRIRRSATAESGRDGTRENLFCLPDAYKQQTLGKESWRSPSLVSSFPYSQEEKLSYSYVSDDDSSTANMFDECKSNSTSPYAVFRSNNYEEELRPHEQFMKMQMGIGNQ